MAVPSMIEQNYKPNVGSYFGLLLMRLILNYLYTYDIYLACDYRGKDPLSGSDVADGQCICKPYTSGQYCNKCPAGMVNLRLENPDGCEGK